MDGFDLAEMGDDVPEFTLKEIIVMQRLFKDVGQKSPSQEFCQELVDRFSQSKHRTGKPVIKWEQVQSWFQYKQKQQAAEVATPLVAIKEFNPPSDWALTFNVPEGPKKSKAERVAGLTELAFEAQSFKDFAWYDVASFLNYRVVHTGELEVRVRFSGFGCDQDEWVNVKRGVRERSIPLVPSECHRVKVGDLVLCFRETDVRAIYCDAYIVEIAKTTHDIQACTCEFLVHYTYDDAEIKVPLSSLCSRPT